MMFRRPMACGPSATHSSERRYSSCPRCAHGKCFHENVLCACVLTVAMYRYNGPGVVLQAILRTFMHTPVCVTHRYVWPLRWLFSALHWWSWFYAGSAEPNPADPTANCAASNQLTLIDDICIGLGGGFVYVPLPALCVCTDPVLTRAQCGGVRGGASRGHRAHGVPGGHLRYTRRRHLHCLDWRKGDS